jgi:hypothetical protein
MKNGTENMEKSSFRYEGNQRCLVKFLKRKRGRTSWWMNALAQKQEKY